MSFGLNFATEKTIEFIPDHEIRSTFGPFAIFACDGYSFFHALSGCDITSSLCGKGKKSLILKPGKIAQSERLLLQNLLPSIFLHKHKSDFQALEQFVVSL